MPFRLKDSPSPDRHHCRTLGIVAARRVEQRLLSSILGATSAFFDSNPTGRLLNRFSSDVYGIDDSLPFIMNILFAQAFGLLGTLAVMSYSEPYFIVVLFPLAWIYAGIQRWDNGGDKDEAA